MSWRHFIRRRATAWKALWIALFLAAVLQPHIAFASTGAPTLEDVRAEAAVGKKKASSASFLR